MYPCRSIRSRFDRPLGLVPNPRCFFHRWLRLRLIRKRFERRVGQHRFVVGRQRGSETAGRQLRLHGAARRERDPRIGRDRRQRHIVGVVQQTIVDGRVGRGRPWVPSVCAEVGAVLTHARQRLDRRRGGNRFGGGEVPALGDVEQAARRVEYFIAMPAAHKATALRELRGLQTEDGFTEGATRRQEHIEPMSR